MANTAEQLSTSNVGRLTSTNTSQVLEPSLVAESRRCRMIRNIHSGNELLRKLDGNSKWEIVYKHAKTNPLDFELEFDDQDAPEPEEGRLVGDHGETIYTEAELLERNVPQLRAIADPMKVQGRSKTELITKIMRAQGTLK